SRGSRQHVGPPPTRQTRRRGTHPHGRRPPPPRRGSDARRKWRRMNWSEKPGVDCEMLAESRIQSSMGILPMTLFLNAKYAERNTKLIHLGQDVPATLFC